MKKFITMYDKRKRSQKTIDALEKRTKDSFKEECDVNRIMAKYLRTGQLPMLVQRDAKYGDFSTVPDYQTALETVRTAAETFDALPAEIRAECDNDPAVFLARVRDRQWAEKHKLALPPKEKESVAPEAFVKEGGVKPSGKVSTENT